MTQWIRILELIGGAAFALWQRRRQWSTAGYFRAACAGPYHGGGGGVLRDLLLGQTPPAVFSDPLYIAVCLVATVLFAAVSKRCKREDAPLRALRAL